MSRAVCPKCGCTDVRWIRDDAEHAQYICLKCTRGFYYPPKTVFETITASLEVLANGLVSLDCDGWWAYVGIGKRKTYPTREEAVAATVKGLKEAADA